MLFRHRDVPGCGARIPSGAPSPGWVMITVMTAALVAILIPFRSAILSAVTAALASVTNAP